MKRPDKFTKKTLNPAIWDENKKMHSEVSDRLLRIGYTFLRETEELMDFDVVDIVVTGSNAYYQWNKDSDIDVHIVANLGENTDLKFNLGNLARQKWNQEHDITVKGQPVEVYIEDYKNQATSDGIWSVLNNIWIKEPFPPGEDDENQEETYKIYIHWQKRIIGLKNKYDSGEFTYEEAQSEIMKFKSELKKMRQKSLAKDGTYGSGNLAFKLIRNSGLLQTLSDIAKESYDKSLTLEQEEMGDELMESRTFQEFKKKMKYMNLK